MFKDSYKQKILDGLVELNNWECENLPILSSVIGRHVYFCIATEILTFSRKEIFEGRSMKQVFHHPGFTERAIRLKIREMEIDGLINTVLSESDKRVRTLVPTPKFLQFINTHAELYLRVLNKRFVILEK